jgi:HSP20 family protein
MFIYNNPFQHSQSLQDVVNHLLHTRLGSSQDDQSPGRGVYNPLVNIYETKDQVTIEFDLPGLNKEDLHLSFENNVLTLTGERRFEGNDEEKSYHRCERPYGSFTRSFTRSFTLANTVSGEGITAENRNGVLYISLPKREGLKARHIEITGEGAQAQAPVVIEAQAEDGDTKNEKVLSATASR